MDVRHFNFLARQPGARLQAWDCFSGLSKRGVAFILANAIFWQPVLVMADGIVVSGSGTSLGQAGNGVPIVNIAAPNGSGLSHNKFNDYNVGQQGLILNNATDRTQSTQLGGIILGNPNLAGRAANVILNEVNGGSPSQLRGYTEVAGQSAHVIVANPYGVTCNGCGFINTPKATLTTGKPVIENGQVQRYNVDRGSVLIEGAGLNASNVDQFEIITRSAKINAEIQARHLAVIAGTNDVDAKTLAATAHTNGAPDAPQLAIDSSALGGMYAGAIKLVSTEAGVGVKLDGKLIASGSDIQLDANGQLRMVEATAEKGAVAIKAGSLDAQGAIYAGTELKAETRDNLTNQKALAAGEAIVLSSGGTLTNRGVIEAGVNADNTRNPQGDVRLTAQNLDNRGSSVVASRDLSVTATQTLNNQGGTLSGQGQVTIGAGTLDNRNKGRVLSATHAQLTADQLLNAQGGLINSAAHLRAQVGHLDNSGGELSSLDQLVLEVGTLDNVAGLVTAGKHLSLDAKGAVNNQGGQLTSLQTLDLKAGQVDNRRAGRIASNQALNASVTGLDQRDGGRLTSVTDVTLDMNQGYLNNQGGLINAPTLTLKNLDRVDNQRGEISSANAFSLLARTLDNSHGKLLGNQGLTLRLDQALSNLDGLISAHGLDIEAATLDNREGLITSRGDLAVKVHGAASNQAGEISSVGATTFTGASLDNRAGQVSADRTLSVDLSGALNNQNGVLGAAAALNLKAASLDNSQAGHLVSDDRLTVHIDDLLDNQQGEISARGAIDLQAARLDNRSGNLVGKDLLTLRADALDNRSGKLRADKDLQLDIAHIDNRQQGLLNSLAGLNFNGTHLDNREGLLSAAGPVVLTADSLDNSAGRISSKSDVLARVAQVTNQRGELVAQGDLTLTGSSLDNRDGGLVGTTRALSLDVAGIDNRGGEISSSQGLTVKAEQLDNSDSGKLLAGTDLALSVARIINQNQGLLFAKHTVAVTGQGLNNRQGRLVALNGLDIRLDQLLDNQQGLISSDGTLSARVGSLNNDGGKLSSAESMTLLSNGALLNRNGSMTTDAGLSLTSQSLDNSQKGLIGSKGQARVDTGVFDNTQGARLISGDSLELTATQVSNGDGSRIASEKQLNVNVTGFDQQGGELFSKTALTLDMNQGQLNNRKGLINAPVLVLKNLADINNQGGEISSSQAFTVAARNLDNSSGKLISQQGLTVRIDQALNNLKGLVIADERLNVQAGHLDNTQGQVSGKTTVQLKAGTVDNQGGQLLASQTLELNADSLDNRQGGLVGANQALQLQVKRADNRAGELSSKADVVLSGDSLNNSDGGKVLSDGHLGLTVAEVINRSKGLLSGKTGLSLTGTRLDNGGGTLLTQQDLDVRVQDSLDNRQGLISAEGRLSLESTDLDNSGGTLSSAQALTLNQRGAVLNQGGAVLTDAGLVLNSARLDNRQQGNISAKGPVEIHTGALDNSHNGRLASNDSLSLRTAQLTNQDNGRIASNGALTANVSGLDQQGGQLFSNTSLTLDLNQGQLNNQQGLINAPLLVLKNLKGVNNQGGEISSAQAFSLAAEQLDNSSGKVLSNQALTLRIEQSLSNLKGLIAAAALEGRAASLDNTGGTLTSRGDLDVQVAGNLNNSQQGLINAEGALTLRSDALNNQKGLVQGKSIALDLSAAGGDLDNSHGVISTLGPLTIAHLRDLNNRNGEISSSQSLDLNARDLDNTNGKLISGEQLRLKAREVLNQAGLLSGGQGLSAGLERLDNRNLGTLSSRNGALELQVNGDLQNSGAGALVSQKALTVSAANLDNSNGGILSSGGEQTLTVSGLINNAQGGSIDSGAALKLKAQTLANTAGSVSAQQALALDALSVNNTNGKLAGGSSLLIERAGTITNQGGQIASQGLMTLFADSLDNSNRGTLAANDQLNVAVQGNLNNAGDGLIYSQNGGLAVQAGSLGNSRGTLQSQGLLDLTSGDLDNRSGRILARSGDLNLTAASVDNRGGVLSSLLGAMNANVTGVLKNGYDLNNNRQGGVVQAQRLTLKALAGIDNYGGRISAQSGDAVITTGDFDNRNGGLYAKGLVKVIGGNFDNSGDNDGQIAGQQIDLNLSGALNNRLGIIESDSTLAIKAASLDNQTGQLRALGAGGSTRFDIGGRFDNRNGTLESANTDLRLNAGQFLNGAGSLLHVGRGTFDISTANVTGAGGSIVTRGALTLNADSWSNSNVIQAGRLTVNVNNFSQTASGQLLASDVLSGSGGNWTNDGLIASDGSLNLNLGGTYSGSGRVSSRGALDLGVGQLNLNSVSSIAGGGDSRVTVAGQLNNAGRLTSAARLNLSAGAVNNQGTLGAAQDLTFTTGALVNDHGLVFSGADMGLRVDSLTNRYGDIYSLGNLRVDRDGQGTLASSIVNRSGSLQSDGSMTLAAGSIQNVRDVLTTDNQGIYTARIGEVTCIEGYNAGDCSGKRNHVWEIVQRDKFTVTAASAASSITAGANLNISGGDLLNQSSTIGAGGSLVATVNNLTNTGVETGETETTRIFLSARTSNAGGWYNVASAVTNKYWFQSAGYTPNDLGGLEGALAGFIGMTEREWTHLGSTRKLSGGDQSYAAIMQAGGAVSINARNGIDNSVVRPGFTYVGSGPRTNTQAPGSAFATRITLNQQLPPDRAQQQVNPLALPGFSLPTGQNGLFRLSGQGASGPVTTGPQGWTLGGASLGTAQREQGLPGSAIKAVDLAGAGQVATRATDLSSINRTPAQIAANASAIDATLPGGAAPGTVVPGRSAVDDRISQTSTLNGQAPAVIRIDRVTGLPDSSVRSNPHKYLIETNPVLTDLKQFMSSDYLLANLGYNPDESAKRLGDGFYEQKLIQQAVQARTGQRFLGGQDTDEKLFKYLMDNAIKSKDSLNLAVGVSLTSEQVAALTHDIVWLENAEVNGEQVLVPVLYLAHSDNRLAPNGALIAGSDVSLIAGEDLNNVGTLRATNNLSAQAGQNLVNSGLVEAGNRLDLLAGNNLVNKAGGIISGRDVSLTATRGDVINERTLTSHQSSNGSYTQQRDFVDSAARVEAANNLVISAGRDINNNGGVLKSGADASLTAGRDVNLTAVEQVTSNDRGVRYNDLNVTQNGSSLMAGRDLAISAGRDLNATASQIEAKRDVAMSATDNLNLSSAANEQHSASKTKKVTSQEDHVQQVSTSVVAGGSVALRAGNDLEVTASRVTAGNEAYLYAGNDLTLNTADNSDYSYYSKTKKGSWGKKSSTMTESGSEQAVSSVIQAEGKTTLAAVNDINISGSTVNTEKGALSVIAGHDLNIEAEQDSQFSASAKSKSGGFGLSTSSKKSADASSSTSLTASTLSGNTTLVQAGNDLLVSASNVVSTEQTSLLAGNDIRIESAAESFSSQHSQSNSKSGLMSTGGIGVTLGSSKNSLQQDTQGYTEKGSTVGSVLGNVAISSGKDLTIKGSDVVAGNDISLIGQNVSIINAQSNNTTHSSQDSKKSGLTLALSGVVGSAVNTAVQTVQEARHEDDSRLAALQGVKAGLSGYQAWQGAQAIEAGADEGSFFGISLSLGTQKSSSKQVQEQSVSQGSGLTAGNDLRVVATSGDLSVIGSKLQAGHDVLLSAAKDIDLRAGANTQKLEGSNKSGGGAVGISLGVGSGGGGLSVFANANSGVGKEKGNGTTWTETTVNAGNQLTLKSGRDTTLEGAQATAQQVVAEVGRNLTLTSLQDTDRFDSKQTNVSGGVSFAIIGSGGSASLSVSQDKIKSRFDSVQEQTGFFAGKDGYQVKVGEHTQLNGSVLASTSSADKNLLDTGTLGWSDIRNKADFSSQHQGVSGGTGGDIGSMFMGNMGSLLLVGANNSGHDSSTTSAAVSEGRIIVRDQDKQQQDVATLSRDVEHANNALSPIFDKEKEQKRLQQAQLIGDIGNQAMDIIRTQGSIEAAKAQKDPQKIEEARQTLIKRGSADPSAQEIAKQVNETVMEQYGTGSSIQRAAQAVTAAVQGLAGGNLSQALVGASAPYLAGVIKQSIPDNLEARLMAHAVLGAVLAKSQDNSALAGAAGATVGELIAATLFPDKSVAQLTEAERQKISALSTLAGGLLGGLVGGDGANAVAGGQAAKNAAENNGMGMMTGSDLGMWLFKFKDCDDECKGKIALQNARGGLILGSGLLAGAVIAAATPEMVALAAAAGNACKANPVLCLNEVGIFISEIGASEALPAGLAAGGAAKLTADQLGEVRSLIELEKQTGKKMSADAWSIAMGKPPSTPLGLPSPEFKLPSGYNLTRNADGTATVLGPRGGVYNSTGRYTADGQPIYRDNGGGYVTLEGGRTQVPAPPNYDSIPIHHICTNKCNAETNGKVAWTPEFQRFFDGAGLDINRAVENLVAVPGHRGPHPEAYHQYVFGSLDTATQGMTPNTSAYTAAVRDALGRIKAEALIPGSMVNKWLTRD